MTPQLTALCASIPPLDARAAAAAQRRLDQLTKPPGSLGQVEGLLVRLAAATGAVCPILDRRAVLLVAGDHGVAAEGVSAYPQAVTAQMVRNFLAGGAAINALARATDARIVLVDAGVATDYEVSEGIVRLNLGRGTGNIAREAAMSEDQALAALLAGADLIAVEANAGLDLLALGEMGIANTTPAAALTSAVTGVPPRITVGRGTGIDDERLAHKQTIVERALTRASGNTTLTLPLALPPLALLAQLGGFEIAALAGAILRAAARRIPVVIDGYITTAAALVAVRLAPTAGGYLFASHRSAEPGHQHALAFLGLTVERGAGPLLDLGLRLGEGSGAALALPLFSAAARLMGEMATFDEAGVSDKT